jgi:carbon storage regulator
MLVLSRKPNEGIVLPGLGVTVRVLSIKGNAVRIGIEAPHDVQVVREELLEPSLPVAGAGSQALRLCPA